MPALSALLHRASRGERFCSGLDILDRELAQLHNGTNRGLVRGSVTELSGPPGTGKTCLALTFVVDALRQGLKVRWIACDHRPFPHSRLAELAGGTFPTTGELQCLRIDEIGQLVVFNLASDCDLVVIEHYDALMVPMSARKHQQRARQLHCVLDSLMKAAAGGSTIVCTSTAIPLREHANDAVPTMFPAFVMPKWCSAKRLALYKDAGGVTTTSTGLRIKLHRSGLTAMDERAFPQPGPNEKVVSAIPTKPQSEPLHSPVSGSSPGVNNKREALEHNAHLHLADPSVNSPAREASWESSTTASSPLRMQAHKPINRAGLGHVSKRIRLSGANTSGNNTEGAITESVNTEGVNKTAEYVSAIETELDVDPRNLSGAELERNSLEPATAPQQSSQMDTTSNTGQDYEVPPSSGEYTRPSSSGSIVFSSQLEWTDLEHVITAPSSCNLDSSRSSL